MKTIFDLETKMELENRIANLTKDITPKWGKMTVGQMLWHCQFFLKVAVKNEDHGNGKFFIKLFKKSLYSDKPYRRNLPTVKEVLTKSPREFDAEKSKLLKLIDETHQLKTKTNWNPHPVFGKFTPEQWGKLEYKHLDHHLVQFGV